MSEYQKLADALAGKTTNESLSGLIYDYVTHGLDWIDDDKNPKKDEWNAESFEEVKAVLTDVGDTINDLETEKVEAEEKADELKEGMKCVLLWLKRENERCTTAEKREEFFDELSSEIDSIAREHEIKL